MDATPVAVPRKLSRRALLAGGLLAGATLAGGGLFVGSRLSQPPPHPTLANPRPVLDMNWNGLDFAWLPGSSQIAYVSEHGVSTVDVKSGKRTGFSTRETYTEPITWSADGARLACSTQGKLVVLDAQKGRALWSYQDPQHTIQVASLSPDGTRVALAAHSGASSNTSLQAWNVQEGKMSTQHAGAAVVSGISWSSDSSRIAVTGQDGSVQLWNVADGRLIWSYQAETAGVISWSPDSSLIAFAASATQNRSLVGTWDVHTGKTLFQAEADIGDPARQDRHNRSAVWSPDSTRIAFWSKERDGQAIQVCSAHDGQRLFTCKRVAGLLSSLTWSPDGNYLAAGNYIVGNTDDLAHGDNGERSVIQFWNAQNGTALFAYSAPKSPDHLSWSPDSRWLAAITPKIYAPRAGSACQSLCRYGYQDPALQVFQIV